MTLAQTDSLSFSFGDKEGMHAKRYILTGKLQDTNTKTPLEGVSIHVDGVTTITRSDRFGTYHLEVSPGVHKVTFRHMTKIPLTIKVTSYANGVVNLELEDKSYELEGVVVMSEEPDRNVRNPISGVSKLTTRELKAIPAFLGEADIFKGLQLLSGVSAIGEGTSGINVRGAKTDQNLLLMNEALVLSSNHALGFLSPFNTDVTETFTLYKGNVPANYGGRAGSALDIQMREGDMENWGGQLGVGTSNARLLVNGPLMKDKLSVIIGGRISNTNWLLKQARDYDINNSKLNFYDIYAGLAWEVASGHHLEFINLMTSDYLKFSEEFGYDWSNRVSSLRYKGILGENFSVSAILADGNFNNAFFEPEGVDAAEVKNGMNYQQAKVSGTWANDKLALQTGLEAIYYKAKPEQFLPYGDASEVESNTVDKQQGVEFSGFASLEWEPTSTMGIVIGLRYSTYNQLGPDSVYQYLPNGPIAEDRISGKEYSGNGGIQSYSGLEPRFSFRQNLGQTASVKLNYSRLFQYIQSISNTFGPTPIDLWQLSTSYIPPQQSDSFALGFFKNTKSNSWEFSVDAFYRLSQNQVEYRDFAQIFQNPHLETELVFGEGKAYGTELMIKKNLGVVTGWLAYTYSRSFVRTTSEYPAEQINDGDWFPSNYDKPHEINLILTRKMYPRGLLSLSVNYATGRPINAVNASYKLGGLIVPDYSQRNEYRIPDYFRVDLSYTLEKVFSKKGDSLNLSIYNLLGRKNAYSIFWKKDGDSQQLRPFRLAILGAIFPSITYSIDFGGGKNE
ncbi:TonB-dependent receptor-like protein [Algoriphagus chordae]|uniref:TonB-dependent receptor-like protein n=1 Tax=Algoriphagus chordae TaxID=237019 RepID=A0A2W7RR16_9BACT|nr:TonB-dependent receptor-like protein [Algoriphagus chordae]